MRVQSLDQEDLLAEEMATPSSTLAWRIPWTEEPGGLTVHRATKSLKQLARTHLEGGCCTVVILFTRPRKGEDPLVVVVGTRCSFPASGMGSGQDGGKEMGTRVS